MAGVAGTYRPGGGYYGLIVVEGPPPSAFFKPGSRPGYVRSDLPIDWFDWRTKPLLVPDLKLQVSVTVHLAGVGDFPVTTGDRLAAAFQYNFNPMASAPIAYDVEPGISNPNYGKEWRVASWTSFSVNGSGEYAGTAHGGLIEGPPAGSNNDATDFPPSPLTWTNSSGVDLEGRVRQTAGAGRVRTATVYTGEGQPTDFTNAAGVITPALETWALGSNPLQRIGTNSTAKSFSFSAASTVYFVRPGTAAEISALPTQSLNVSTTQIPSGQTASGGFIRPPTHLAVRAAAVAAVPKAVYRIPNPNTGNGK
jgi:hypothetical protein